MRYYSSTVDQQFRADTPLEMIIPCWNLVPNHAGLPQWWQDVLGVTDPDQQGYAVIVIGAGRSADYQVYSSGGCYGIAFDSCDDRYEPFDGHLTVRSPQYSRLDIGADAIYVCVPRDRDSRPVRAFATFTVDLHTLADWLVACRVDTVAMASTGIYWLAI